MELVYSEFFPSSAVQQVVVGKFLCHDVSNVLLLFCDRIEIYVIGDFNGEKPKFVLSEHFSEKLTGVVTLHHPTGLDAIALCMDHCRVCICAYNTTYAAQSWVSRTPRDIEETDSDVETGAEENFFALENNFRVIAVFVLKCEEINKIHCKMLVDETSTFVLVMLNKQWLYIIPIQCFRIDGTNLQNESEKQAACTSILPGFFFNPEENQFLALKDDLSFGKSDAAAYTRKLQPIGCTTIDLASLSPPLLNIRDICLLQGYGDATFLILHEPEQSWVGRLKLKSAQRGNVESKTLSCIATLLCYDCRTHVLSVAWRISSLPYNSQYLFPVLGSTSYPMGSALCVAPNCIMHLTIQGCSYAICTNSYGVDEFKGRETDLYVDTAPTGTNLHKTKNALLANCSLVMLSHDRGILATATGELHVLDLRWKDGIVCEIVYSEEIGVLDVSSGRVFSYSTHGISSEVKGMRLPKPSSMVYLPGMKTAVHASLTGNTSILDLSLVTNVPISELTRSIFQATLCESLSPISSFDVLSTAEADFLRNKQVNKTVSRECLERGSMNYNQCLRSTSIVVTGGEQPRGVIGLLTKSVHTEHCTSFTTPSIENAIRYVGEVLLQYDELACLKETNNLRNNFMKNSMNGSMRHPTAVLVSDDTKTSTLLISQEDIIDISNDVAFSKEPTLLAYCINTETVYGTLQITKSQVRVHALDCTASPISTWDISNVVTSPVDQLDIMKGFCLLTEKRKHSLVSSNRTDSLVTILLYTSENGLVVLDLLPDLRIEFTTSISHCPVPHTCIAQCGPKILIGVEPRTFKCYVWWIDVSSGELYFAPACFRLPGRQDYAREAQSFSDEMLEVSATDSILCIRLLFLNRLLVYQLTCDVAGIPIFCHAIDTTTNLTWKTDSVVSNRLLYPLFDYSVSQNVREKSFCGIFVSGMQPMWLVQDPFTGRCFAHPQSVPNASHEITTMTYLRNCVCHENNAEVPGHQSDYFCTSMGKALCICRISKDVDLGGHLPLRKRETHDATPIQIVTDVSKSFIYVLESCRSVSNERQNESVM